MFDLLPSLIYLPALIDDGDALPPCCKPKKFIPPAAAVFSAGAHELNPSDVHVRIQSLESSAKVVKHATGKLPPLNDPMI